MISGNVYVLNTVNLPSFCLTSEILHLFRFQGERLRQGRGVRSQRVLHHPPLGCGRRTVPDSVIGRIVVCQVGNFKLKSKTISLPTFCF